jgi:hypothetical protein
MSLLTSRYKVKQAQCVDLQFDYIIILFLNLIWTIKIIFYCAEYRKDWRSRKGIDLIRKFYSSDVELFHNEFNHLFSSENWKCVDLSHRLLSYVMTYYFCPSYLNLTNAKYYSNSNGIQRNDRILTLWALNLFYRNEFDETWYKLTRWHYEVCG